jgi:hypothetical protein
MMTFGATFRGTVRGTATAFGKSDRRCGVTVRNPADDLGGAAG